MFFILITIVFFCLIIYFMPKRITPMEMYTTSLFSLVFVMTVDTYLSYKLELYGYFTKGIIDWKTLIIHYGVFPTYNVIFLNFFPTKRYKVLYILGHALILIAYEWIAVHTEAFYYNNWKLTYSALLYPLVLLVLYWDLKLVRMLKNLEK